MKKFLTFALSVCAATGLFANIINWELGNVTNDDNTTLSDYDIVFLTDATQNTDGTYTVGSGAASYNNGSSSDIQTDGDAIWGTWTDDVKTNPTNYYVAVKSGDTYYAVADPNAVDGVLTYDYNGSATPSTFDSGSDTTYKTVGHVVPEPATAVLALAGVAMLIRRRKA